MHSLNFIRHLKNSTLTRIILNFFSAACLPLLSSLNKKMLSPSKHQEEYDNPFANSASIDPFQDSAFIEPDLDLTGQSTVNAQPAQTLQPTVTGNIGNASSGNRQPEQQQQQQQQENDISMYSGIDTLDEPVIVTIVS